MNIWQDQKQKSEIKKVVIPIIKDEKIKGVSKNRKLTPAARASILVAIASIKRHFNDRQQISGVLLSKSFFNAS